MENSQPTLLICQHPQDVVGVLVVHGGRYAYASNAINDTIQINRRSLLAIRALIELS